MKHLSSFLIITLLIFSTSCEKEENNPALSPDQLSGYVQKGPYLNGTDITVSELSGDLTPTGKNFSTQTTDNQGYFEFTNVTLSSEFAELKANGFYFNEVKNENSAAQLTLFALSELTDKTTINVNLLSSLEKNRIEYLISNGSTFSEAKKQAQSEVLKIFEIEKSDMTESESLDITQAGEDNAILLAISVMMQGHLAVSDLSELLANISTDIREDGVLNSQTLGSMLINNARTINPAQIREHLESRYETLGLAVTVPDFEQYITHFINHTDFEFTGGIEYPEEGKHGLNILNPERTEYVTGTYSMAATVPEGMDLKVKIVGEYHWYYRMFQSNTGWDPSDWNDSEHSRTFTANRTGEIDFEMTLDSLEDYDFGEDHDVTYPKKIDIFVYENNADEPSWTKEIHIE